MADLYLTPAERYTAALGGFYYGDLPEPGTVYTQLIKDILDGATPDKEPKNILARFIYSLYISDLGDPYPRYELAKLLYWKLHDITPTKSGSILTVTIDGKEDYMTINTDLSRLWYKVLFGSKTDVITEFPYIFNTMQNKLSDWGLFGNTSVSGTPTPDSPIMPQGTGERTGNLWNEEGFSARAITSTHKHTDTNTYGTTLSTTIGKETIITQSEYPTGTVGYQNGFFFIDVDFSKYEIGDKVTLSFDYICNEVHSIEGQSLTSLYAGKNSNNIPVVLSSGKWSVSGRLTAVITIIADMNPYVEVRLCGNSITVKNIMLNTGSTALTYEPYGYKIPISSAGQTTPVYLGEVETTRKIRKLVLTGNESINYSSVYARFSISIPDFETMGVRITPFVMSHYIVIDDGRPLSDVPNNAAYSGAASDNHLIFVKTTSYTSSDGFKSYLATQYAAGTPVCVWYVLANETTATVNEPLMKIGNYADSMSRAKTGIDIPTVVGQNTLDVLTTVKPSSMRIEYTSAEETRSRSKRISLLKRPLAKSIKA